MARTHHNWYLRPPPGTRFSRVMNTGEDGTRTEGIRLDYGPNAYVDVPSMKEGIRHYINGSDLNFVVPVGREHEFMTHLEEWVSILGVPHLKAWLDTWLQSYLVPQTAMAAAQHKALTEKEAITAKATPNAIKAAGETLVMAQPASGNSTITNPPSPTSLPAGDAVRVGPPALPVLTGRINPALLKNKPAIPPEEKKE